MHDGRAQKPRYDKAGNLIGSADLRSGTTHYTYDQLGRILEAANAGKNTNEKFAFDPAGNILDELARNAREGSLHRPQGNRIAGYDGTQYHYDALGNLTLRELPDGESQLFEYDTENQLIRAKLYKPNGEVQQWQYAYDPFGRRISKERIDKGSLHSTDPKRTVFIWDGSKLVQEYNYKGVYTYFYTDQDSYEPLAHVFLNHKDEKLYLTYYHTDQIGIPREQTDQFGNLLWTGEYDAWGSLQREEKIYPNAHQPFRLQNQYFDAETGLHYNLFRYYAPECGRFINQDPIGLVGGMHLYSFAPNALIWLDPLGLLKELVYQLLNDKGEVIYYGITNDASRRCAEHRDAGKQFSKMQILAENLTHHEARTFEGAYIRSRIKYSDRHASVAVQLQNSGLLNKNRGRVKKRWKNKNPLINWKHKLLEKPKDVMGNGKKCNQPC